MRFYSEYVAEALAKDPPDVRGLIDGQYVRRLMGFRGSRRSKVLVFDVLGELTYREVTRRTMVVALADSPYLRRFSSDSMPTHCPSCALELPPDEFWSHYNKFHARRPWWPNEEHWKGFALKGKWLPPHEQR